MVTCCRGHHVPAVVAAEEALASVAEHEEFIPLEAISTTLGLLLKDFVLPGSDLNMDSAQGREELLEKSFLQILLRAVGSHVSSAKYKGCVANLQRQFQSQRLFIRTKESDWNQDPAPLIYQPVKSNSVSSSSQEGTPLKPQLSLENGDADLFVPTKELAREVIMMCFFLAHGVSVILHGARGSGKSTAIEKAIEFLPKKMKILKIHLGSKEDFSYEDSLLANNLGCEERIVIVEGFSSKRSDHVHYVRSLMTGRLHYTPEKEKFVELNRFTLCIETTSINDPFLLRQLSCDIVPIYFRKPFDDDSHILTSAMSIFAKDFAEGIQGQMADVQSFIVGWHKFMSNKFPQITDHALYRIISGLLLANPEEVTTLPPLYRHLYNEIASEYSAFSIDQTITELLEEFSPYFKAKFFDDLADRGLISFFQTGTNGARCTVELRDRTVIRDKFLVAYEDIKGKSFNDQITFCPEVVTNMASILRSYHRYSATILVGPYGCGKRTSLRFAAHFMGIEFTEVEAVVDLSNFKIQLREAFEASLSDKDKHTMIYVKAAGNLEAQEILTTLENMLFYYDLPGEFSVHERTKQLFKTQQEEYEALCDDSMLNEALEQKAFQIQDRLHVVVDLLPETFHRCYPLFPHLFVKSGIIAFREWSMPVLQSIAQHHIPAVVAAEEAWESYKVHYVSPDILQSIHSTFNNERLHPMAAIPGFPLDKVTRALASLHFYMMQNQGSVVASSQYLDLLDTYPVLYEPLYKKLESNQTSLKAGIQCVIKANGYIQQLSEDITSKEPEIQQLAAEIEQLNKRLSLERMNLDKASKAFRRKEVAARKKSEETQELAADAHRNLEHALPSLDAAMQAINAIEKSDIMEIRTIKNPPEILQQVLEAVCILLGVKADWSTAKMVLADPYLQQKLLDYDKDNISEQVSKRIRRYIDNPKFIPDEVAKTSKAACSFCMWVRAIDLYTKIFKSIEPKRIKLLQAESELAELMTALREETDRVAHTETTIASIQSTLQERTKRKANVESMLKQMNGRLERAQMLSYSLEEECKKWKEQLETNESKTRILCGETILTAMTCTYACYRKAQERSRLRGLWKSLCDDFGLATSETELLNDFLSGPMLVSPMSKYSLYNQNWLSTASSCKWTILVDPHNLASDFLHSENTNLVELDFHQLDLKEQLKQAVVKGSEVLIRNFHLNYPRHYKRLFTRNMKERVHAYVGLVGLPVIRKDMRVVFDGQEVICHSKFHLYLHTNQEIDVSEGKKDFNIVFYDYDPDTLEKKLFTLVMRRSEEFQESSHRYEELENAIETLERSVAERKEGVLGILLSAGQDFLDDPKLVTELKEAKARVFEALNDLLAEKKALTALEETAPSFQACAVKIKHLVHLGQALCEHDPSLDFLPADVFHVLESLLTPFDGLGESVFRRFLQNITSSIHKGFRVEFNVFAELVQVLPEKLLPQLNRAFAKCIKRKFNAKRPDLLTYLKGNVQDIAEYANVTKIIERAESFVLNTEKTLINHILESSRRKPILLLNMPPEAEPESILSTEIVYFLAIKAQVKHPPLFISSGHGGLQSVNHLISIMENCRKEGRWVMVEQSVFSQHSDERDVFTRLQSELRCISEHYRVFVLAKHGVSLHENLRPNFEMVSITLPDTFQTRMAFFESLLCDNTNRELLKPIILFHVCISHKMRVHQPLKLLEIFVCKASTNLKQAEPNMKILVHTARQVYGKDSGKYAELEAMLKSSFSAC